MNLEQIVGSQSVQRIPLAPGQAIEVGRATAMQLGILPDPRMSARHFAVACDDGQCRVHDLGSTNGTFVNGARIAEAVLADGDRIEAGESTFVVRLSHDGHAQLATDGPAAPGGIARPVTSGERSLAPIPLLQIANDTPFSIVTLRWPDVDNKPKLTVV